MVAILLTHLILNDYQLHNNNLMNTPGLSHDDEDDLTDVWKDSV